MQNKNGNAMHNQVCDKLNYHKTPLKEFYMIHSSYSDFIVYSYRVLNDIVNCLDTNKL